LPWIGLLVVGSEVEKEQQVLMLVPWPSFQVVVEVVVDHCLKQVLIPLALLRY
jgi:hypothetical protein